MEYDSFENPVPMCEETAQIAARENLLTRERKAYTVVAEACVDSENLPAMCRKVLDGLTRLLGFQFGSIRLYDKKEKMLRQVMTVGFNEEDKKRFVDFSIDNTISVSSEVARRKQPLFASDIVKHPIYTRSMKGVQIGLRAFISWPVIGSDNELLGILQLGDPHVKPISDNDQAIFKTIATLLASGFKRMQTVDQLAESLRAKEKMLLELTKQEALLTRERKAFSLMAEAAVYTENVHDLCQKVISGIVKILGFDFGVIRLKSEPEKSWVITGTAGLSEKKQALNVQLAEETCIAMLTADTGKPIFAPDADLHKIRQTHAERLDLFKCKAFVAWPLQGSSQKVIGVLTLIAHKPKKIPDKDRIFFETLSSLLAMAIERKKDALAVKKSLSEKELLLNEIHHRVKNNMQVMSSLINLQAGNIDNQNYKNAVNETRDRIKSMALVHEQLYKSRDFTFINLKDYITQLSSRLMRSYSIAPGKIDLNLDVGDFNLSIVKAVPCGLIINELISNALKYAFPDDTRGRLWIKLNKDDDEKCLLSIKDNGIGLTNGFNSQKPDSLGFKLVTMLIEQIDGNLAITDDKGTEFIISFAA
jgi:two-component sensor histidine kinase